MARKRKKSRNSGRLISMLIILAVLIIAVVALIRFLDSGRGRAFLLDVGFHSRYEPVQREVGERVMDAFRRLGVGSDDIRIERRRPAGEPFVVVIFTAAVPADASLIRMNGAIDDAVRSAGGRVRACREVKGGRTLEIEIGTRRRVTHRCRITKERDTRAGSGNKAPRAEIALLVDDFGYFNNRLVRDFLSLDIDLTISVIPGLRHSEKICRQALDAGKEVLCHLPMEPEKGADDSGEIPLVRVSMESGEIREIVRRALRTTPGVSGVNNHMGSKATADRRVVKAVLDVCRDEGLFFIDSLTSSRSVVGEVADEEGVPSLRNDMFIDNRGEETRENMEKLLSVALRRGRVLAILHVRKDTLADLRWFISRARREGIEFVKVSALLEGVRVAQAEGGHS